jgi:hypothetical protein
MCYHSDRKMRLAVEWRLAYPSHQPISKKRSRQSCVRHRPTLHSKSAWPDIYGSCLPLVLHSKIKSDGILRLHLIFFCIISTMDRIHGTRMYVSAVFSFVLHCILSQWIYRGDDWLLVRRWEYLLARRSAIDIVQVISWNGKVSLLKASRVP